jgi:hypothetical protein
MQLVGATQNVSSNPLVHRVIQICKERLPCSKLLGYQSQTQAVIWKQRTKRKNEESELSSFPV